MYPSIGGVERHSMYQSIYSQNIMIADHHLPLHTRIINELARSHGIGLPF